MPLAGGGGAPCSGVIRVGGRHKRSRRSSRRPRNASIVWLAGRPRRSCCTQRVALWMGSNVAVSETTEPTRPGSL